MDNGGDGNRFQTEIQIAETHHRERLSVLMFKIDEALAKVRKMAEKEAYDASHRYRMEIPIFSG